MTTPAANRQIIVEYRQKEPRSHSDARLHALVEWQEGQRSPDGTPTYQFVLLRTGGGGVHADSFPSTVHRLPKKALSTVRGQTPEDRLLSLLRTDDISGQWTIETVTESTFV